MKYYMKITWTKTGHTALWQIDEDIIMCRCLVPVNVKDWTRADKKFDWVYWAEGRDDKIYDILLEEDVMLELM